MARLILGVGPRHAGDQLRGAGALAAKDVAEISGEGSLGRSLKDFGGSMNGTGAHLDASLRLVPAYAEHRVERQRV